MAPVSGIGAVGCVVAEHQEVVWFDIEFENRIRKLWRQISVGTEIGVVDVAGIYGISSEASWDRKRLAI